MPRIVTYYNDVSMKLEAALKAVIDAQGIDGLKVNTGITDQEIELPCCICSAEKEQEEEIKDTGIFKIKAKISVRSSPENSADFAKFRPTVAQIFDAVLNEEAAAQLSEAIDDFHCYDITRIGGDARIEDKSHVVELILDAVCCGSEITSD
jgi:hypothetical protein